MGHERLLPHNRLLFLSTKSSSARIGVVVNIETDSHDRMDNKLNGFVYGINCGVMVLKDRPQSQKPQNFQDRSLLWINFTSDTQIFDQRTYSNLFPVIEQTATFTTS